MSAKSIAWREMLTCWVVVRGMERISNDEESISAWRRECRKVVG